MAKITLGGEATNTIGDLPSVGSQAPEFVLVTNDLGEVTSTDFEGKNVVLNIFPSIDTGVCSTSVRKFNQIVADLPNTVVVCVSKDLPFALDRFCGAEGIENAITTSAFRSTFGEDYEVTIADGPMRGLLSRAVVVADPSGNVVYTEQVPEIKTEPDYQATVAAVEAIS